MVITVVVLVMIIRTGLNKTANQDRDGGGADEDDDVLDRMDLGS